MASSVNKVILIGHLGHDPEVRRNQNGDPITSLSIATSEDWRDKQTGEKKERTEWHRIVIFNKGLAEIAEKYLKKGSKVYLEGQLQTRKWTDKSGVERYVTEIVLQNFRGELTLLDNNKGSFPPPADSPDDYGTTSNAYQSAKSGENAGASFNDMDDEIPF